MERASIFSCSATGILGGISRLIITILTNIMRILFVEDEPELSSLAASQLSNMGHTVFTASSVEDAYAIYERNRQQIEMVLADHRLPDGHGIDFILDISRQNPKLRVAVISGVLTSLDIEVMREQNIPYFVKPVLYSNVVKELKNLPPPGLAKAPVLDPAGEKKTTGPYVPPPFQPPGQKKGLTSIIFSRFLGKKDN